MFDRVIVFDNPNNAKVEIRECSLLDPPGHYSGRIILQPFSHCEFRAARFYSRNLALGQPSVVLFAVNGKETRRKLTPQHFLRYVKMIAYVDDQGGLTIKGIEPSWTDFCRLRGFKFLGRNYEDREEKTIV